MKNQNEINSNALNFEASVRYLIEKSNQRAWLVAFISMAISIIAVIAVIFLTPLKTTEPYVIKVDNTTGMVDIITSLQEEQISSIEALDKYFISQYIKAREGYYYKFLNQDYVLTQLMSDENVANEYRAIYAGDNALDQIYKDNVEVSVKILSIVLGNSNGVKTSTIRALITKKDSVTKSTQQSTKVITLAYDFLLAKTSEENRILNPLGFKVTNYRVDEEIR
ncbi:type IV secretion system protein [Campylobacter lari]|uniref:virB8 family protein n=1 Tax=Campylobacter TaxID=194 RepID=UPI000582398F|nr:MULTISPECIES: type IV secretion system protein [Campylobacter]MCR8683761.1 type IV secretion system protein [Campylobacter sp. LMG 17559]AJC85498.1 conjugal transfer protein TraJ/VirB8 [Campylobacter peloridis LMG 23910]MCH3694243.1 type IV secretion system protein [Campylobacter lari]MCH3696463.1 type IV secretion system protein [Campylobacter lari]MCR2059126.1 type IV secretion system protein [Campylobacter lari subsp. concheus]